MIDEFTNMSEQELQDTIVEFTKILNNYIKDRNYSQQERDLVLELNRKQKQNNMNVMMNILRTEKQFQDQQQKQKLELQNYQQKMVYLDFETEKNLTDLDNKSNILQLDENAKHQTQMKNFETIKKETKELVHKNKLMNVREVN